MSVQTRIMKEKSLLESLKELSDIIKDPKAIKTAHETIRAEIALTESEMEKVEEGRTFLKTYDAKCEELNGGWENLRTAQKQHREEISVHENKVSLQNDILATQARALSDATSQHEKDKLAHDILVTETKRMKLDLEKEQKLHHSNVEKHAEKVRLVEFQLEQEKEKVRQQSLALKAKTAQLQSILSGSQE